MILVVFGYAFLVAFWLLEVRIDPNRGAPRGDGFKRLGAPSSIIR